MPNIKSAIKRVRQSKVRTERNKAMKTRVKSTRKRLADAVEAKDKKAAAEALTSVFRAADKAAKTNVIHKNAAARYKSKAAALAAQLD